MNTRSVKWLGAFSVISLLCLQGAGAEEPPAAAPNQDAATPMQGMQQGGMGTGQGAMGGMQHGGMGSQSPSQEGMGGMQHGGPGGGMMGGMGGGMMGGMMASMSDQELDEAFKQLQSQDIRLGELRRQMREANDQASREKLKAEHRSVLKEQLVLAHKLMMQQHMKSMMGSSKSGAASAPPVHTPNP